MPFQPVKLVVSVALLVPAAYLLAFGPRGDRTLPHDEVIVDYWEKWTGNEQRQMAQIVDGFNSTVGKEKHIYVRYVSTSAVNRKTLVATAAGVPPDVAGLWETNLVQFAALDALQPLEDLAAAHGITSSTYKPVYFSQCNYAGHLYALISTPMAVTLHYNKRMFEKHADKLRAAGLDPTRAPRTIAELDAYAKVLDEVAPDGRITCAGYLPMEPGWYINFNCYWFGANWWDDQHNKFQLTDPRVVQTYKWVQSYSKRLGKQAVDEFRSGLGNFDSPQNAFLSNALAMEQQGPWMANYIHNNKPEFDHDWAASPFPTVSADMPATSYCSSDVLVIPRGARHPKEAFEFIAYVNRQDVMEHLCSLHCKNSPLAKVSEEFLAHHPNPYIRVFETLARGPGAHATPQNPIEPEVEDEMSNMTQQIALLQVEPEAALQDTQARLQEKYDRFMEKQRARQRMQ